MPVFNIYRGQLILLVLPDIIRIRCLILLITNKPLNVLSLDNRLKRLQINNRDVLLFISDTEVRIMAFLVCFLHIYFFSLNKDIIYFYYFLSLLHVDEIKKRDVFHRFH